MLTVHRRLTAGPVLRAGRVSSYRGLIEAEGEAHTVRSDLTGALGGELRARRGALLALAHLTDLHVTDIKSPARFEFLNRFAGDPRFRELLPMQRPQEALNVHAVDAMVRAVNAIEAGPVSGSPLDLVVMTGDAIDNTQWNELSTFMSLFDGGLVGPGSGGPELECVQSPGWPDDTFWKPDGGAYARDQFRAAHGFPVVPGLLDRSLRTVDAPGLRLPWIGCHGNHEEVCQGVGVVTPELALAMIGGRKPIALPDGFNAATVLEQFVAQPHSFMTGPTVAVTADPARRPAGRHGFVEAHFTPGARLDGHGFTSVNRRGGTAYYVHDTPGVRLVTLDTACNAGGADGCLDRAQVDWLEDRLIEVHASYIDRGGSTVRTSNENRLVVLLSHHPLIALRNRRATGGVTADQLLGVLNRFQNIVLWLNGHIHANAVRAHGNRAGVAVGFWEVTTSSLVDWPCQGRVVEIFEAGGSKIGIACTMIDHDGEVDPGAAATTSELAGLHRQLAANDPMAGMASSRAGSAADRNVVLALAAPFPPGS